MRKGCRLKEHKRILRIFRQKLAEIFLGCTSNIVAIQCLISFSRKKTRKKEGHIGANQGITFPDFRNGGRKYPVKSLGHDNFSGVNQFSVIFRDCCGRNFMKM